MSGAKRVHYIDNLRWITVFLLVLYHAAMAYNTWGEANYIFFSEIPAIAAIVTFISPWFMPLLFLLAGISSCFSLRKRTTSRFLLERAIRLGIPLLIGLTVINPILSYVADVTHNGYDGSFFSHYGIYFTRFTDLTGYDGGFTLGHLWFIAVLLLISVISCGIISVAKALSPHPVSAPADQEGSPEGTTTLKKGHTGKTIACILLALTAVAAYEVKPLGKPLIVYFCLYLLGYCLCSMESGKTFAEKLAKGKWIFTAVFLAVSVADIVLFHYVSGYETLNTVCSYLAFITGVTALFSLGHDYLDYEGKWSKRNAKISYTFYIVHFPIVVLTQYILMKTGINDIGNFILTNLIAYPLTYALSITRMKK